MTKAVNIHMVSLGCAKNTVNSEQMLHLLAEAGYAFVSEPQLADIAIVNTCGFIESAADEAIEKILELAEYKKTGHPGRILAAGCLCQRYGREVLREMPEVDGILGCGSYDDIVSAVEAALGGQKPELFGDINAALSETPRIVSTPPYSAYIKIAEGCDNRCSYCVIPSLRGKYRSRGMEAVIKEARVLVGQGVKELIVVAQDITRYGLDLYGRRRLPELLEELCRIEGFEWIRLHYLYPDEISDELIDCIAKEYKIVRYLDIPIQHINDGILKAMNRRGTKAELTALFHKLRARIPGLVLRTSLICGLPGEGEEEFLELYRFLEEQRIERVGVFPFSPQEGTAAYDMPGAADEQIVNNRIYRINNLQSDIMDEYNQRQIGKTLRVLCEGVESDLFFGRTYADSPEIDGRILFRSEGEVYPGDMPEVIVENSVDGDLYGRAI